MTYDEIMAVAESHAWVGPWVHQLAAICKSVEFLPGFILECGSYRGGTAMAMAAACPNKVVYAYDTFAGMPEVTIHDQHKQGDFGGTDFEEIKKATSICPNLVLVRGKFEDTIPHWRGPIAALFLDCDLYQSYQICLQHLWPQVVPGGVVILEDYGVVDCQGATKAIDEWLGDKKLERREGFYAVQK